MQMNVAALPGKAICVFTTLFLLATMTGSEQLCLASNRACRPDPNPVVSPQYCYDEPVRQFLGMDSQSGLIKTWKFCYTPVTVDIVFKSFNTSCDYCGDEEGPHDCGECWATAVRNFGIAGWNDAHAKIFGWNKFAEVSGGSGSNSPNIKFKMFRTDGGDALKAYRPGALAGAFARKDLVAIPIFDYDETEICCGNNGTYQGNIDQMAPGGRASSAEIWIKQGARWTNNHDCPVGAGQTNSARRFAVHELGEVLRLHTESAGFDFPNTMMGYNACGSWPKVYDGFWLKCMGTVVYGCCG